MGVREDRIQITNGIPFQIMNAVRIAYEKQDKETLSYLNRFVRNILGLSFKNKSLQHFHEYINFPSSVYLTTYSKTEYGLAYKELHNRLVSDYSRLLREVMVSFSYIQNPSRDEKVLRNDFYYSSFESFSTLLYTAISNEDIVGFSIIINQFNQISNWVGGKAYDLKVERLQTEFLPDSNEKNARLFEIDDLISVEEKFDIYRRHVLTGIKYWTVFLFSENKIGIQTAEAILDKLNIPFRGSEELVSDVLDYVGKFSGHYMGWESWDHMERLEMEAYTPPSVSYWFALGFLVEYMRYPDGFYINSDKLSSEDISAVTYLFSLINRIGGYIKADFAKWETVLKTSEVNFDNKLALLVNRLAEVKRKAIGEKERQIADAALDADRISGFKNAVGVLWKREARIRRLFERFGNFIIAADNERLKIVGYNSFYEKAKMMFISGQHAETIFGSDTIGANIGRGEDEAFFRKIIKKEANTISEKSIVTLLIECVETLRKKGKAPNIIFVSPEFSYRDRELRDSGRFVSKIHDVQEDADISFFLIGTFDGIPMYSSYSRYLTNKVVVANFNNAFQMKIKEDPSWFENRLKVDILEVDDDKAQEKLNENPDKWRRVEDGIILSEEDALILIKTSVIMQIWSTVDFSILDAEEYIVGNIIV